MQPANFLFYRVFTKENATSFLRKSSSPFLLQELRPLTLSKATDRFTSLMVIGMTKIMCNNSKEKHSYSETLPISFFPLAPRICSHIVSFEPEFPILAHLPHP
jgi:hypothetical protein